MDFKNLNNLFELFQLQNENYKNEDFLHKINPDKSISVLRWNEVCEKVHAIANYLKEKGITKGDRVMLVSEGRPEWMISDLSILASEAITVPNYTTYTKKDFEFILKDCQPRALIVSNEKLLKTILSACREIDYNFKFIISFEEIKEVEYFKKINSNINKSFECNINRKDPACIIYTSGTQGNPKGVILSHGGILANCEDAKNLIQELNIGQPRFLTWLPLSHSYEHTVQFVQISLGAKVFYSPVIEKLLENIKIIKPHIMTAVPRFYNNLYNKMLSAARKSSKLKKDLFFQTLKLGEKKFRDKKIRVSRFWIPKIPIDGNKSYHTKFYPKISLKF